MKIQERKAKDVTILKVSGKITIGEGDVQIRDAVRQALAEGSRKILLDMEGVSRMDSAGVGELMAAYTTTKNQGGELALLKLSPKVAAVLQITQLHGVLNIFQDEAEAIASLAG